MTLIYLRCIYESKARGAMQHPLLTSRPCDKRDTNRMQSIERVSQTGISPGHQTNTTRHQGRHFYPLRGTRSTNDSGGNGDDDDDVESPRDYPDTSRITKAEAHADIYTRQSLSRLSTET